MKNAFISGVIALVVALVAVVSGGWAKQDFGGQTSSFHQFFDSGSTDGGIVSTTTTAATYTTLARDFATTPAVISWLPNLNTTVSLSSTSTLVYVPKVGDSVTIFLRNASTTAGSSITFAAVDAGVDLQFAEATGGDLVLNGLDWAKITFIHTATNLVTVIFDEMTEAD